MLMEEKEFEHCEALAASMDRMLLDPPYNVRAVGDDKDPDATFLILLPWRSCHSYVVQCYDMEAMQTSSAMRYSLDGSTR